MKTLMVAVALATVFDAPAFAQSVNAWGWKGGFAAPASAKSANDLPHARRDLFQE